MTPRRILRRRRALEALAFTLIVALATPASALAQSAPGTAGGVGCFVGICDPGAWLRDVVGQIVAGFLGGLIGGLGDAITAFPNDVDFVLRTPENLSFDNETVKQLAAASRALANALLAVVALVGGFNVMFGRTWAQATPARWSSCRASCWARSW
jgi:hypothetical protein